MRFANKSALVTGAASGIGRATALRLAAEGARVAAADVDTDGLRETLALAAGDMRTIRYDAADLASVRALVADAAADGLDILCNIAGLLDWGPTLDFDEARFERLIAVNLTSVYALCRAALPHLVASRGTIVNMASTAGVQGTPYAIGYAASKHGVVGLTKSLAVEFAGRGVRINAVCPGQVDTPMTRRPPPEGDIDWALMMRNAPKLADGVCAPEDVAEMVAFLASDQARKITGALFTVDGGQLAG
ncbi:short-chain dehydrogenase [Sphingopyxis lindanitolerans]|uniref:Short-chain dehydrogenase n=1 Tax=Sphingopyxis lindanitolerans TaxID=2054227 RepID=A0A2S8B296_9SPHN|nr:SDR family NAD(P)-dependent oxidoreductase [Sphingopyxis lindanitolerans]PQM26524.1 short-chain dehydrogenase [Sphingopyxis lindanitolerans]